jgi:hypothetical protein
MTLKDIEKLLLKHLEESGEIRTDLKWLKRAFWAIVAYLPMSDMVKHLWK